MLKAKQIELDNGWSVIVSEVAEGAFITVAFEDEHMLYADSFTASLFNSKVILDKWHDYTHED